MTASRHSVLDRCNRQAKVNNHSGQENAIGFVQIVRRGGFPRNPSGSIGISHRIGFAWVDMLRFTAKIKNAIDIETRSQLAASNGRQHQPLFVCGRQPQDPLCSTINFGRGFHTGPYTGVAGHEDAEQRLSRLYPH
jgi:hypothetical protein